MPMTTEQMQAAKTEMLRKIDAAIMAETDPVAQELMIATANEQAERLLAEECAEHYGI